MVTTAIMATICLPEKKKKKKKAMTSERLIALLTTTMRTTATKKTCPVKKFRSLKVTKKNKAAACSLKSRARSTDSEEATRKSSDLT